MVNEWIPFDDSFEKLHKESVVRKNRPSNYSFVSTDTLMPQLKRYAKMHLYSESHLNAEQRERTRKTRMARMALQANPTFIVRARADLEKKG